MATVKAPLTYSPGKGRPKEYLAYLNEREMAFLRSINGDNMERGPRGLPSFPPDDSLGSDSRNSKAGGGSRGPGGPSGPNSGPSGGGGLGGGNKGAGSSKPDSSAKASTTSSKSSSSSPSTPSSPMGGQGASFSTPKSAAGYNADKVAQQKVQVRDTRVAISNTPAARNDLAIGGIRTLSVGPMGTNVNVGRPAPAKQFYDRVPQSSAVPRSTPPNIGAMKDQYSSYKNPNAPMAPMVGDKLRDYLRAQEQFEREMRNLGQSVTGGLSKVTPTGNPNMAGGVPTVSGPRKTGYSGASLNPESPIQQSAVDRALINTALANSIGPVSKPASSLIGSAQAATPGAVDLAGAGYGTFNVPNVAELNKVRFEKELERAMTPVRSIPAPPSPVDEERILAVEDYPDDAIKQQIANQSVYTMGLHGYPKEQMLRPGMYSDPQAPEKISEAIADAMNKKMAEQARAEVAGGLGIAGIRSPEADTYFDAAELTPGELDRLYNGPTYGKTRGIEENVADADLPAATEPWSETPYGEPGDIQRPKSKAEKYSRYAPFGFGAFSRLGSMAVDAEWSTLSPSERMALMEKWDARRDSYIRNQDPVNDRGELPPPPVRLAGQTNRAPKESDEAGSRPAVYYKWDIGIDIPSPGDSGYNLYLKYLEEKAGQA